MLAAGLVGVGLLLLSGVAAPEAGAVHVYVSNQGSNSVSVFGIGASGALAPVTCDPATSCKTGVHPFGVAVDPSGSHVYVVNNMTSSVSVFSIGADGALSPVTCDPTTSCKTNASPEGIAIDPSGSHLYVTTKSSPSGSLSVFAIGANGALSPVTCDAASSCKTPGYPDGVAVDPAGKHVYVSNSTAGSVAVFAIGADGALSPVTCDPTTSCKAGAGAFAVGVDPSGGHVYVTNSTSPGSVSVFAVGAGGVLAPVTCDPATSCKTGDGPEGVAFDPNGKHLYTSNASANSVSVFAIGANGALSPVTCDPATSCKTSSFPQGIGIDPLGAHLYTSHFVANRVSAFAIGASGALSPITCDPTTSCKTGSDPSSFSLAISPDRGPTAGFSTSPGPAGSTSQFDASASSSPDYPISAYVWSFGDGQTQTSGLPAVQHTYTAPGTYTVTLTVTDQAACGLTLIYTGQTASCNGSAKAQKSQTITVPPAPVPPAPPNVPPVAAISRETISPSVFPATPSGPSARAAKKRKRTYGAKVTYTLNETASVRFTVQRRTDGRRIKHGRKTTCDPTTKRNRTKKRCTRYVTLKGSFTRAGHAGTNKFRFTGRLNGRRLSPGTYRLVATPTANRQTGRPASASFRIIK